MLVTALFLSGKAQTVLILAAYVVLGYDILWKAVRNLFHGRLFDENFLMALATIGAIAVGQYPEAVAVMVNKCFDDYERQLVQDMLSVRIPGDLGRDRIFSD